MDDEQRTETVGGESGASASRLINRVLAERYELLESIGEGPMMAHFRARDRQQNRIVAVKALQPAYRDRPDVVEKLRQGLSQTLALNHPGIARPLDVGSDPTNGVALFVAEEYLRGIDLKERIRRAAPLALTAAVDVAVTLVEALEFAHARGVAHGDIRPQNVLIGGDPQQTKLAGFGMALAQNAAVADDAALLKRVVAYAAPEAAESGIPRPDADLYSVGVLLFEMLTADLPYRGDTPVQIALRHVQDPVPSPRVLNQAVPRALDGVVRKALAKRPAERYQTAAEMLKDLNAVRDALRYGRSLAWSPLDEPADAAAAAAAPMAASATATPAATAAVGVAAPSVMPVGGKSGLTGHAAGVEEPVADENATVVMPSRGRGGRVPQPPAAPALEDEKETLPVRNPSGSRWLLALNLFLAIVLTGVVGYLVWFTFKAIEPSKAITVPNLVGKTMTQAKQLAVERKFQIEVVDEQFDDKVPSEVILQQRPEPGRQVLENSKVSLWVSRGPRMVEIPDVRDVSFEKARQMLEKAGLRLGERKHEFDPLVSRGNVISQAPQPSENRPRGTRIDLVLSKGPEPLPTPEPILEPTPDPRR